MKNFLTLSLLFLLTQTSYAAGRVSAPGFNLEGLNRFIGKAVTVFYVSGRAAGFSAPGSRPRIRSVLAKSGKINIYSLGTVQVPSKSFFEYGWVKYNYLQIVVHSSSQNNVAIQNLDGSIPEGQSNIGSASAFNQHKSYFIPRSKVTGSTINLR